MTSVKPGTTGAISLRREPTNLTALLRSSLQPLRDQAAADGIELRVEALGAVPERLPVDREKIAWAVTTLVGSAVRHARHGTRAAPGGSILVHVERPEAASEVLIAVHDDGPGIDDDKLPFLFERKEGADHAAGLSLLMVRDVVEAHGGKVEVESRRGQTEHGTSITLHLPVEP